MARTLVYSFPYGPLAPVYPNPARVDVYLQDELYITAECLDDPGGFFRPTPESVTVEELGRPEGSILYFRCETGDLVRVRAQLTAPFAYIQIIEDSPSCVVSPEPCAVITSIVTKTDETVGGLHDGTITASTEFDVFDMPIEYSLDGVSWQASGSFIGLMPGVYQVRSRISGTSCANLVTIEVLAGEAPVYVPYPWQYNFCRFFRLISNATPYDIAEPVKWDQVKIIGKRDLIYHGWLYQYSDGSIDLEFDCPAGKEVLEAAYLDAGSDALVTFQYGIIYKGVETVLFESMVNFNTYKNFTSKVAVTLERSELNQLFTSRVDIKVKMNASDSLTGGTAIIPPVPYDITLHGKEIVRNFSHISPTVPDGYFEAVFGNGFSFYIFPDTNNAQIAEIAEFFGKDLGVSSLQPDTVDNYTWLMPFDCIFSINVGFVINTAFAFEDEAPGFIDADMILQLVLNINGVEQNLGLATLLNITENEPISAVFSGSRSDLSLKKGDKVYLYVKCKLADSDFFVATLTGTLSQLSTNIVASVFEKAPDSTAKAWLIHDVVDHCVKVITDGASELKSKFLSRQSYQWPADGQGSMDMVTNGRQIRKFGVDTSPLTVSLKDMLISVNAESCIGFGFEKSGTKEVVRLERADYFYQDRQIHVFTECTDFREDTARELLYNQLEFGYEIFQDSGYNTNDEFNTRHEYATPIKTNKLNLPQKSKLIRSGYKIESSGLIMCISRRKRIRKR